MLNRRSDSNVPSRPQLGHHPQLHRNNNSAHETRFPYTIPKFTSSTPSVDLLLARSTDHLPLLQPPRPGGLHRASLSTSNLPQSFAPVLPSNAPPEDRSGSVTSLPTPAEDFAGDGAFLNAPTSPSNRPRYSFNDLSNFSFPDFSENNNFQGQPTWAQQTASYGAEMLYRQSSFAASTGQLPEWPELTSNADSPQNYHPNISLGTPQRSSVVSMDQPGLTHSPSNTASDVESYAHQQDTHANQSVPQSAVPNSQTWNSKDFVDPHSLEMGPESYNSTQLDLPYRSQGNNSNANDIWPDYFQQTGSASSTAESVTSGMPIKRDPEELQNFANTPGDFENGFDGDMGNMNFDWDNFQAVNTPGFGHS